MNVFTRTFSMRRLRNLSVSGGQSDLGRSLCFVSENAKVVVTSFFYRPLSVNTGTFPLHSSRQFSVINKRLPGQPSDANRSYFFTKSGLMRCFRELHDYLHRAIKEASVLRMRKRSLDLCTILSLHVTLNFKRWQVYLK